MLNAKEKSLERFTNNKLIVLHENETAYAAARAMRDNNIGCVLVCNHTGKLVGLLTDRDLVLRSICDGLDPSLVELGQLMTRDPAAIGVDQNIHDAIWLMRSVGVRRMPIVGRHGKPIGLITLDGLLLEQVANPYDLREMLVRQMSVGTRLNPQGRLRREKRSGAPSSYSISPEVFHEALESYNDMRHEARAQQSLGKLIHLARACLEERGVFVVERDRISNALRTFLACLVRRVVPGEASAFISQLPSSLHDELLSQPAGPDVTITSEVVKRAIRRSLLVNDELAWLSLEAFCEAMCFAVSPGEIHSLCSQLPRDLRDIFLKARGGEIQLAA